MGYGNEPKFFYFIKATFSPSESNATASVGHIDLSEGKGRTSLNRYNAQNYEPKELHLWVFTEIKFLGRKQENDVCILQFEHVHTP